MKSRTLSIVILAAIGALAFAYWFSNRPTSWNEEVQLRSGEVLTIRRTIQFKEYQPWGGGGGGADTPISELEFVAPQGAGIPTKWSHPSLLPMVLDRDPQTNEWFIVATFFMCQTWHELGRPELPYAEFRFRGDQWQRVRIDSSHIGWAANVLVPNQADVRKDQSLSTKKALMSRSEISPEYTRIVGSWKTNC